MTDFLPPIKDGLLEKKLSDFFPRKSQKALETDLYPDQPELFAAIAWARNYGVPKVYANEIAMKAVRPTQVFFEANLGKQYTGNPRYIYEEMLRRYPDYKYIWCYSGDTEIPGNPKIIKNRSSSEYYKLLATSGTVINNTTFPLWFLRKDTFYLQTWHGTPLKKMHWDVTVRKTKSTPAGFVKSTGWNALLSPNHYSTRKFESCFRYNGHIVETGYPANDVFSKPERYAQVREDIRAKLGVSEDKKVVLYAPTWRDGTHLGNAMFRFDLFLDIDTALAETPDEYVYLIRAHHMSEASDLKNQFTDEQRKRIIDVSGWDDAIELMCAADVLVSDYSSIVYDWACSRKPTVYYIPDFEEYETKLRGMYYDMNELNAGPLTRTTKELCAALMRTDEPANATSQNFLNMFCSINDGSATDRVLKYLEDVALPKPTKT